ncbi:MAG: hypothetical protein KDK36_19190 [Leptospiraceae bacterium]|nr:hypothetical protein [Leptospiraceae bacterium]
MLENNPYGSVTVNISSNVSLLTFNGQETTSLTFDSSNYSTEQTITIAAGIDANSTNEQATISFSADGLDTQRLSLTITDDLTVSLSGTVTTIQEGQTVSLGVILSKLPPIDKTVTVTSSNSSAITINGTSTTTLNFTPSNYNTVQTLTLLAVIDPDSTNNSVTITFSMEGSPDLTYSLTVIDDNTIQVSNFPANLLEGTSQTIGVRFSKALLTNNSIVVTSNNPAITINGGASATLNYTTVNGTADQLLTIQSEIDVNLASESVVINFTGTGIAPLILNITATDKDTQNIVITGSVPTLDEGLTENTGKLKVALAQDPGGTAIVTVTSSDTDALTIDPATTFITFDNVCPGVNCWSTPKNVNITALEDSNETSETVNVIFNTPGAPIQIYNVITVDNDTRIIIDGASNVNEGGTNTITVSLSGNPGVARDINLTSNNTLAATLSNSTVTLTPSNYSQNIVITGVEDANIINETVTVTGSYTATCAITCTGLTTGTRGVNTVDNDSQSIILSGGAKINEGGTLTLNVKLAQDPSTPYTVNLSSGTPGSVGVSSASVILNSSNYNTTGVNVTLTGVEDSNESSEIVVITASGTGVNNVTHSVTTIENDTKPVISGSASVAEGGFTVLTVKLSGNPGENRTVNLTSPNPASTTNYSISPTTFNFSPSNYDATQTFIVTGIQDTNVANENFNVTLSMSGSGGETTTATLGMNTVDDDLSDFGLIVTNVSETTTVNEGSSLQFKVRLNFEPLSSPYTVTISSPQTSPAVPGYVNNPTYVIDPANSGVGSTTLAFTSCTGSSGCWDTDQTVTINAPENYYIDDKTTTLTFSGIGVTSKVFNITVKDNDPIEHRSVDAGRGSSSSSPSVYASAEAGNYKYIYTSMSWTGNGKVNNLQSSFVYNISGGDSFTMNPGDLGGYENQSGSLSTIYYLESTSRLVILSNTSIGNEGNITFFKSDFSGGWWPFWSADNLISGENHTNLSTALDDTDVNNKRIFATTLNLTLGVHEIRKIDPYQNISASNPSMLRLNSPGVLVGDLINSIVDKVNQKLIISFRCNSTSNLCMHRCNLDLTGCSDTNISEQIGADPNISGNKHTIIENKPIYDSINNKIIILSNSENYQGVTQFVPKVFVCNSDISGCYAKIIQLQPIRSGTGITGVIDPYNKKLLILTHNIPDEDSLGLFRCDLDGNNCTYRNLSRWLIYGAGFQPVAYIDHNEKKLKIVTVNKTYGSTLSMFSMMLYID